MAAPSPVGYVKIVSQLEYCTFVLNTMALKVNFLFVRWLSLIATFFLCFLYPVCFRRDLPCSYDMWLVNGSGKWTDPLTGGHDIRKPD